MASPFPNLFNHCFLGFSPHLGTFSRVRHHRSVRPKRPHVPLRSVDRACRGNGWIPAHPFDRFDRLIYPLSSWRRGEGRGPTAFRGTGRTCSPRRTARTRRSPWWSPRGRRWSFAPGARTLGSGTRWGWRGSGRTCFRMVIEGIAEKSRKYSVKSFNRPH